MQRPTHASGEPVFSRDPVRILCFLLCTGLVTVTSLLVVGLLHAEVDVSAYPFPDPEPEPVPVQRPRTSSRQSSLSTSGIDGRFGHFALPTVGRDTGITHLELFPYVQADDSILFADLRGFLTNEGRLGGNFGLGARFIEPNQIALFGINGWYDADQSTGSLFHQLGFGLEARTEWVGLGANFYFPVGSDEQVLRQRLTNIRYEGNQILFDTSSGLGESMPGLDVSLSAYLPFDFAVDHQIQITGGWYHFTGTTTEDVNGFKVQIDGNIVPAISAQSIVTHDKVFGTNATIGFAWRFGSQGIPETDLDGQLRRFVDRNYNVIVGQRSESAFGVAAINPATGNPYSVQHVGSGLGTGLGTVEDPWASVAEAQAAGGDLIVVRSGTSLSESIVLDADQVLLGEGVKYRLSTQGYGRIWIPQASQDGGLPTISSTSGDAITMADRTTVAGIVIRDSFGNGIVASGVDGITISDVTIDGAAGHGLLLDSITNSTIANVIVDGVQGDGIHIANIDDVLVLDSITVRNPNGNGISIVGGHGEIELTGETVVTNARLAGLSIQGIETITETIENDPDDDDDDEEEDLEGTVLVENLKIQGGTGGQGIRIADSDGLMVFEELEIETDGGSALYFRNAEGARILDGKLTSSDAPVIDLEDSLVDIHLTSIFADGGSYGLRMVRTDGQLLVYGDGADDDDDDDEGTGGLIRNTDVAVHLEDSAYLGLQSVNFKGNGTVAKAIDSEMLEIVGAHVSETSAIAVDATNLAILDFTDSTFEDNSFSSGTAIDYKVNIGGSFTAVFAANSVSDSFGNVFQARTLAGGEAAKLTYSFEQNTIELAGSGDIASLVDWTGVLKAAASGNAITGEASMQKAFQLTVGESTSLAEYTVSSNLVTLDGADAVGIELSSQAPTTFTATSNQFIFNGRDGTGIKATLGKASTVNVSGNAIYDQGSGATGILFPSVADGTIITLDGNYIDLSIFDEFIDQGIILSAVTGDDDPTATFRSSSSNTIIGASTIFYVPTTGVNGQLIINESLIQ